MGVYRFEDRVIDPAWYPWGYKFWTPVVGGASLWLDATDADTITLSAGAVSQWADKSGNNWHASQTVSTRMPIYVESRFLYFDGVNDFLDLSSVAQAIAQNVGALSIFAAVQMSGGNDRRVVFACNTEGGTSSWRVAMQLRASNAYESGGRRLNSDSMQTVSGVSIPSGLNLLSVELNYAAADLWVGINGTKTQRSGGFQTAGNTSDTPSTQIAIGAEASPNHYFGGYIGEIFVLPTIDPATCQNAREYLAHRWGIAL